VSGRLRRSLAAMVAVLALLPLAAASVSAAPPGTEVFGFSEHGLSASADQFECQVEGDIQTCSGMNVFVFSGQRREQGSGAITGTQVCMSSFVDMFNQATDEFISATFEFGCTTDVGAGTEIERDLSSATIAPTTVDLQIQTCDPTECTDPVDSGSAVVEGTFTGTGPVIRQSSHNSFDDGICTFRDSFRGTSRQSTFSGTIDGQAVEIGNDENGFSQIGNGHSSFSGRCVIEP
jgi:hypothetical protein